MVHGNVQRVTSTDTYINGGGRGSGLMIVDTPDGIVGGTVSGVNLTNLWVTQMGGIGMLLASGRAGWGVFGTARTSAFGTTAARKAGTSAGTTPNGSMMSRYPATPLPAA